MKYDPIPFIGVGLGSPTETAALSVTERVYVPAWPGEVFNAEHRDHGTGRFWLEAREKVTVEYRVRHLERQSPPVRYKKVADRVADLVATVGECVVVIDVTRTGRPAYVRIMEALRETGVSVKPCPVNISNEMGGVSRSPGVGWSVPRRDLVTSALLLFEQGQLKIAEEMGLTRTLAKEFEEFKPKAVKEELEGWRLGTNDDLVLAVAMSVWAAETFLRKEETAAAGSLNAT